MTTSLTYKINLKPSTTSGKPKSYYDERTQQKVTTISKTYSDAMNGWPLSNTVVKQYFEITLKAHHPPTPQGAVDGL